MINPQPELEVRGSVVERRRAAVYAAGVCLRANPDWETAAADLRLILGALGLDLPAAPYLTGPGGADFFLGPQT